MKLGYGFSHIAATLAAAVFALIIASSAGIAKSPFKGTWKTTDTKGGPFEITLSAQGVAAGDRGGEKLKGTWKDEGDHVMISWDTDWTTKISKSGDKYTKSATHQGKALGETSAEKTK